MCQKLAVIALLLIATVVSGQELQTKDAGQIYYEMSVELAKMQERDKLACYKDMADHVAARLAAEARVKELEAEKEKAEKEGGE